ncbi:ankyrin repeat-containing protein BDA1-like [Momordica charantia]|uniref:Ankyrin repeat-containing protein BDA1-like n=1 Tax=Momordica charantia TaxID=3673 RepID=A0A6J1DFI1_MOMCH|nr:ankyrin repeat-containing protein BDA1-like [Momordica charantia]
MVFTVYLANSLLTLVMNHEIQIEMSFVEENTEKLYEGSKIGCIQTLKTLIQDDPRLIQKVLVSTSNIESPLHVSVSHGHLEFTRLLLDHDPELAAEVDASQRTPLHLASENGDMETIQALLEKNTSACLAYDNNGLIPLHCAVIRGEIKIMQQLIKARPQSIWMKLKNGQTILHLCVENNHLEAMKLLVETFAMNGDKDLVNAIDDAGNTILDLSIVLRQIEMVGYLLSIPEVKTKFVGTKRSSPTPKSIIKRRNRNLKIMQRRGETASLCSKKRSGRRWGKVWRNDEEYKAEWFQEVQGRMMLVATVIATVTFQAAINPPGGVWQQDTRYNSSSSSHHYNPTPNDGTIFPAGSAIMAYRYQEAHLVYLMMNTVSFLASASVILLIISRFPLKNKICSWILTLTMGAAVAFLALGYLLGARLVSLNDVYYTNVSAYIGYSIAFYVWFGMIALVNLCYVLRFLVWVFKIKAYCAFSPLNLNNER